MAPSSGRAWTCTCKDCHSVSWRACISTSGRRGWRWGCITSAWGRGCRLFSSVVYNWWFMGSVFCDWWYARTCWSRREILSISLRREWNEWGAPALRFLKCRELSLRGQDKWHVQRVVVLLVEKLVYEIYYIKSSVSLPRDAIINQWSSVNLGIGKCGNVCGDRVRRQNPPGNNVTHFMTHFIKSHDLNWTRPRLAARSSGFI